MWPVEDLIQYHMLYESHENTHEKETKTSQIGYPRPYNSPFPRMKYQKRLRVSTLVRCMEKTPDVEFGSQLDEIVKNMIYIYENTHEKNTGGHGP